MAPIRYDDLASLIDSRAPACGTTKVIAVDGPSGAGKTDFANALSAVVHAPVVHLEDIYPGWSGLDAAPQLIVAGMLSRLAVGEIGAVARWDWGRDSPAEDIKVPPNPLLILEGVGSGARLCRPYLSMLIWLEAPAPIRKQRALSRDGQTYAPFWDMWAAQEQRLFATDDIRAAAEVVVDTAADGILDITQRYR
ncbi:MAG: 4-amino-4-deoxy-L-arabinose transferase [Aeromicrobium sp.]